MIEIVTTLGQWPRAPLGELCDIRGGFPAPQDDAAFEEGEIPFVRMKDVGRHHFTNNLCETDQSLNRAHFENGRYQLTPRGSILMPRSGSVGLNHRAILTIDAVVVSHLCALVPTSDKVTTDFLYRFLCLADMRKLTKKTTGLDSIAFSDLRMVAIPLPPLAEQRRIAEVLDRAEALRAKRRAALAQLDSLTQSILTELLSDCCELKTKTLEQISKDMHQGINTVTEKIDYQTAGYPIIQSKHVTQGFLDLSDARFVNEATFAKYKTKYSPAKNDLLLCNIGTIGKSLLMEENIDFLIAWNLFLIKLDEQQVSPCFCKHYFDHLAGRHYFDQFLTGGTVKFISKKTLGATPIPIPPIALQREFARRVTAVEALKTAQRASLAELDALFATLQHRAFRGEL